MSSSGLYHPVQGASKGTFIPHNTIPAHQLQQGAVGRGVRNLTLWTPRGCLVICLLQDSSAGELWLSQVTV